MKNTSAYLYFYDDRGQYSKILHLTTLCASIAFKHVYLCVSEEYLKTFSNKGLLPENVELYCIGADSLNSPTLQRLDNLYKFKQLRSNCPPVERHCVNRWLFLAEKK